MSVTLSVERRSVYGNVRHYVVGPEEELVRVLTGTRSISAAQLAAFRSLGFDIQVRDVVA